MNEDKCIMCRYCHSLHELIDKHWVYKSVCTLFADIDGDSYSAFCLVVDKDNDYCEYFERVSDE